MTDARSAALLAWYRATPRDIPWQHSSDPYLVLVGEVMSQQTQASRAANHYRRFVGHFGDVESLAAAPLADVLRLWSGLGYNSRAKRLREAARVIARDGWPTDLETLPGVGPYTAAAIACYAFGAEVAVVDTNVRRVLGRWRGSVLNGDAYTEASAQLRAPAADWNSALMNLGALVCTGRNPQCAACPVAEWCSGPDAYQPPPSQSRYRGSRRQVRSRVLLHLAIAGPTATGALAVEIDSEPRLTDEAVRDLLREGLVVEAEGVLATAD